jgi:hypothetical protein
MGIKINDPLASVASATGDGASEPDRDSNQAAPPAPVATAALPSPTMSDKRKVHRNLQEEEEEGLFKANAENEEDLDVCLSLLLPTGRSHS